MWFELEHLENSMHQSAAASSGERKEFPMKGHTTIERGLKECPSCHTMLFEDMGRCYQCMYDFEADSGSTAAIDERLGIKSAQSAEAKDRQAVNAEDLSKETAAATQPSPEKPVSGSWDGELLGLFLVELSGFLSEFVADRVIGVKKDVGVLREDAAMCSVTDKQIDP